MTTPLEELGDWLQTRIDTATAAGAASRQGEVDAAVAALAVAQASNAASVLQIAQLTAQLAAKQAELDAYVAAHPDTPPPPVIPPTVTFSDFLASGNKTGLVLPNVLDGQGRTYTIAPHSSKRTAAETNVNNTNPLTLLVVGGPDTAHPAAGVNLRNFILLGTPQGHNFNGLRIGPSQGAIVEDVFVGGIPGSGPANPEETFSINGWHANGMRMKRVTVDGRDATLVRVSASNFGFNNLDDLVTDDLVSHYALYGTGLTHYLCSNITHNNTDASGNKRPFNFERCSGKIVLNAPNLSRSDSRPHITLNTDGPSAQMDVHVPVSDTWPVRIGILQDYVNSSGVTVKAVYPPNVAGAKPQTQKVSDVHVFDAAGKDITGDKTKVLLGNVW